MEEKYTYEKGARKSARVGQAVMDMLNTTPVSMTVEELLEQTNQRFLEELDKTIGENRDKYGDEFHIFVLGKKELGYFGVTNADRNWFIARQSAPDMNDMMKEYPNFYKTLYKVNAKKGDIWLKWTLPSWNDCKTIKKNPNLYDADLVKWVNKVTVIKISK